MERVLNYLALPFPELKRGTITFQVANLHVYPRHFALLEDVAYDIDERLQRRVWQAPIEGSEATA
jgi:thymidylate synthase